VAQRALVGARRRPQREPASRCAKSPGHAAAAAARARLNVADGTLEALKWLGLVLMTLDHLNKFVFEQRLPLAYEAGRVALPLFAFVLGYNLARPGANAGASVRSIKRMLVAGLVASPMFVLLVGWWPLNVLFTLALAAAVIHLLDRGGVGRIAVAGALFVFAGALVEFWWFGVLACLLAWVYCKRPTVGHLIAWTAATAALGVVNGNLWSLAALPLVLLAPHVQLRVPRHQHWFYAYYPVHLAIILAAQAIAR